ncbi:MAG: hypothetical protein ACT4PM_00050 [Gemmatimonadales bacterium]
MRPTIVLVALAVAVAAPPVAAQDTMPEDPRQADVLRQMIEQRFGERLREELGLSNDQMSKLRVTLATVAARRRVLQEEERRLRQALARQLRPGVAANPDSVERLVDALTDQRVAFAETFREEMRDLSTILNPVQRGQYLIMRDRLMAQAEQLRQRMIQQQRPPARPNARRPPFD